MALQRKGEDGEEDDGAGIQVQQVDLVMRNYGIEDGREGGNQTREESMEIDGDLGGAQVTREPRRRADDRRLPLIGISRKGMADLVQPLLVDHRRLLESWFQGRQRPSRGARLPLLPPWLGGHGGRR